MRQLKKRISDFSNSLSQTGNKGADFCGGGRSWGSAKLFILKKDTVIADRNVQNNPPT